MSFTRPSAGYAAAKIAAIHRLGEAVHLSLPEKGHMP
jgi:hypothetical protein